MDLPSGDVTFLFSDIEGSTRLAHQLGAPAWSALLREHDRAADVAVGLGGGSVVKHEGDGVFAVFADPAGARPPRLPSADRWSKRGIGRSAARRCETGIRIRIHTGDGR